MVVVPDSVVIVNDFAQNSLVVAQDTDFKFA
jgi:hypothetical protein